MGNQPLGAAAARDDTPMQRPQRYLLRYDYLHYDHASMTATISMDLGFTMTIRSPTKKYS
jgi:hypothetical protein